MYLRPGSGEPLGAGPLEAGGALLGFEGGVTRLSVELLEHALRQAGTHHLRRFHPPPSGGVTRVVQRGRGVADCHGRGFSGVVTCSSFVDRAFQTVVHAGKKGRLLRPKPVIRSPACIFFHVFFFTLSFVLACKAWTCLLRYYHDNVCLTRLRQCSSSVLNETEWK